VGDAGRYSRKRHENFKKTERNFLENSNTLLIILGIYIIILTSQVVENGADM
jgi:hypothetical protein